MKIKYVFTAIFLIAFTGIATAKTIGQALKVDGEVNILKSDTENFSVLKNGDTLQAFDIIRTTANSSAELSVYGVHLTVPSLSKVKLAEVLLTNNRKQPVVDLYRGAVNIGSSDSNNEFSKLVSVKTNAHDQTIFIEQSEKTNVSVGYRNNTVFVSNGGDTEAVLFVNGGEKIKVKENMVAFISPSGISMKKLSDSERNMLMVSPSMATVKKTVTEYNTSLLTKNNNSAGDTIVSISNNSSGSTNTPDNNSSGNNSNASWVAPEQWTTNTNLNAQSNTYFNAERFLSNGLWGQSSYISAWAMLNAGTDNTLTAGNFLHLSGQYKLHEAQNWVWDENTNTVNAVYVPLTEYYGVASETDLGFNVQLGGNVIMPETHGFSVADSVGNKWLGRFAGFFKPDNTFKIDYGFMYITPSGEIGYGKLNSPFTGNADTINSLLKASAQYTLTPSGNINIADFESNPENYYSLGSMLNLDYSLFDNSSEYSTLYHWKGTNKGIFLGLNWGMLLQSPPSGNKVFLGNLQWDKFNKTTFVTDWANGEITGTFSGKFINENIYGTSSGNVFGLYDNAESNYALVASGDVTGTPVSAFVSSDGIWDTGNNYRWTHGYATLAPSNLLTYGTNIYGYGYVQNIPSNGKFMDIETGFSYNANSYGWDVSKDTYSSGGVELLDIDNRLYRGGFIGIYRKTNGEAGIFRYSTQANSIDADGYYDISGTVTNIIPVGNALITVDRPSPVFSSVVDWWHLSLGFGSLVTDGISVDTGSQHVFSMYGTSLADCSSWPCSPLSWGYSIGKLSNLKYTSMLPSFSFVTNDPSSLAGYVITSSDNLDGTVTGKYYGGNVSSNISNGDTTVYLTAGDVTGAYSPATSTLNMAMIGTHISVNSYLSMVDDPAKQPTLQAMGIPITERYNATINSGTFYDASNTAIGTYTTVGLNNIRAFGDTNTEGIWTMQINGNHAINADQWSGNVNRIAISASSLDGTSYNVSVTGQNNNSSLMSGGIWKGFVTGTGSNGMTLTGGAAGTYTGGDGFGVSGSFTGTGGGAWKR